MTLQERKQYEWYMKKYQDADAARDPDKERERISMIIAALFPSCSHMPPERTERKQGRKKGLQGETPGESRDDIKARTAAQKLEQQQQRAKARQKALEHAAPSNVHHMSTRQKTQVTGSSKRRSPSPSSSSSSSSTSSSSSAKPEDDKQEEQKAPEEQPNVPEPLQPEQPVEEPSFHLKLSKRLSKKTPRSEAYASATPSRDEQEALDMPPPEIPSLRQPELPPSGSMLQRLDSGPATGHQSGDSSYASIEDPMDEQQNNPSSSKRRKSWASLNLTSI